MDNTGKASRKKFHFIYKTTCLATNKFYVGMHSTDNMDDGYLGSGIWMRRALKKYGSAGFVREVLELLPDRKSLRDREKEIVTEDLLKDPLCKNMTEGGSGDREGPHLEETKQKIGNANRGKKHTPEARLKMSETKKKRFAEGKIEAWNKGKQVGPHTEEWKRDVSEKMKGRIITAEHASKISASNKGRVFSEEHRINLRAACARRRAVATATQDGIP